jgi:hypothetical protein
MVIKEGDRNTIYFHVVANHRRRKTLVHSIDGPDGEVNRIEDIIQVATQYYKDMFKFEHRPMINVNNGFFVE